MPINQDVINQLSGQGNTNGGSMPMQGSQGLPGGSGDASVENSINQFLVALPLPIKQAIIVALKNSENTQ